MADWNKLPIAEIIGYGEADHGEQLVIQVRDDRGVECRILVAHEMEAQFLGNVGMAAQQALEARTKRDGGGLETTMPIHIKQIQGFPADNEIMILRLRLATGMQLDLPLDAKLRQNLKSLIDQTEEKMRDKPAGRSKPN